MVKNSMGMAHPTNGKADFMAATAEKTGLNYDKLLKAKKVTKNIIEPSEAGWDAVVGFLPADKRL